MARRARRADGGAGQADPDAERNCDDAQEPPGDPENTARVIVLRMLDRRAYSRAELADALARRDVPDDAAATVLDRFTELGLIDDRQLAEALAGAVHRERGLARRAVTQKLRQRGIDAQTAADAVVDLDSTAERARAEQLVARRLPALRGLDEPVRARRLVGLLARKGYPSGLSWEVVRAALSADGDDVDRLEGAAGLTS